MIEVVVNGNNTTRDEKEIYTEFVNTKLYDFIKGGFTPEPRDVIAEWLRENYELNEHNFSILFTYITVRI